MVMIDGVLKQHDHYVLLKRRPGAVADSAPPKIRYFLQDVRKPTEYIFLGEAGQDTSTEGLVKYFEILEMRLRPSSYAQVMEAFVFMHPWEEIYEDQTDFNPQRSDIMEYHQAKIERYREQIQSLTFHSQGEARITFWAYHRLRGDLEHWTIFSDDYGRIQVKPEIIEQHFFRSWQG